MAHLRTADLVEQYGIPEATWRWWRHRGEGPRSFKLGKTVFYAADDVAAWVESQKAATARVACTSNTQGCGQHVTLCSKSAVAVVVASSGSCFSNWSQIGSGTGTWRVRFVLVPVSRIP
jgi:prophage regulatory protein